MIPPKCRICGMREHNHRCQGGSPAQQVAEQQRLKGLGRSPVAPEATAEPKPQRLLTAADIDAAKTEKGGWTKETLASWGVPWPPPPGWRRQLLGLPPRPAWHEDSDSEGEPTEVADTIRRPARFYAPPGQCVYCDRRRAAARVQMRAVRERGEA